MITGAATGGASAQPTNITPPALPIAPAVNTDKFAADILAALGMAATANRLNFMRAWIASENTKAKYNPLATTWNYINRGATFFNCLKKDAAGACTIGVQNYPDYATGLEATVKTLNLPYYDSIRAHLANDTNKISPNDQALKKAFDTWGTTYNLFSKVYPQYGGKVTTAGAGIGSYILRGGLILAGIYVISQAFSDNKK